MKQERVVISLCLVGVVISFVCMLIESALGDGTLASLFLFAVVILTVIVRTLSVLETLSAMICGIMSSIACTLFLFENNELVAGIVFSVLAFWFVVYTIIARYESLNPLHWTCANPIEIPYPTEGPYYTRRSRDDLVCDWCAYNCKGRWRVELFNAYFSRKRDAVLFMMFKDIIVCGDPE